MKSKILEGGRLDEELHFLQRIKHGQYGSIREKRSTNMKNLG